MNKVIKSPYTLFGGKSKVAPVIWSRLGEVSNYIEPFAGTLATLLANPSIPKIETVNDINCFISNFWRAVSAEPDKVAEFADYPVTQTDLHARHRWLVSAATDDFKSKMDTDPDYYDVKIAGWWVWGMGASIGNNWLNTKGLKSMPLLSSAGGGIHGLTNDIGEWFESLQDRMRRVRVACGDWTKVVTPSISFNNKGLTDKDITGILLDPPYDFTTRAKVYATDEDIFINVVNWAIENENNTRLRIALCGYDGDWGIPNTWEKYSWKANGGMANLGNKQGKQNATKEVIWFSPSCLKVINTI